jgi:nitroreductase/FMN reductase [NAD(P)H]
LIAITIHRIDLQLSAAAARSVVPYRHNGTKIAAECIGLGCCPISAIRNQAFAVSELLGLPDHVFPIAGLALGWPAENPPVSMRLPLSCTVHRNRFSEDNILDQIMDYDRRRAGPGDSPMKPSDNRTSLVMFRSMAGPKTRRGNMPTRRELISANM